MLRTAYSFNEISTRHVSIWFSMAFQAGAINAGGFIACHRFVTHTTGFATYFGTELATGHWETAIGVLTVPFFFLIGAMVSGYLIDHRLRTDAEPRYDLSFGLIATLMLGVVALGHIGFFGVFGEPLALIRDYALLAILCLSSGIQNATITSASGAVVRTTHLTGITTDLGIGLVRVFTGNASDSGLKNERKVNWLRFGIIASFILGSTSSAFLFYNFQYLGFLLPAAISIVLTVAALQRGLRDRTS